MAALKGDIVTEGFGSRIDGEVMNFAKCEVRVCCRSVCADSCVINYHSEGMEHLWMS